MRHGKVAQHASVRRKKSQQVQEALGTSGQVESSTSGACASPHVTPSSSSRRRRDSPSDASLHPSSRTRQISSMSPLTSDVIDSIPPPTDVAANLVPPPESESFADAESDAFGGSPVYFSLLPRYPDHIVRHI